MTSAYRPPPAPICNDLSILAKQLAPPPRSLNRAPLSSDLSGLLKPPPAPRPVAKAETPMPIHVPSPSTDLAGYHVAKAAIAKREAAAAGTSVAKALPATTLHDHYASMRPDRERVAKSAPAASESHFTESPMGPAPAYLAGGPVAAVAKSAPVQPSGPARTAKSAPATSPPSARFPDLARDAARLNAMPLPTTNVSVAKAAALTPQQIARRRGSATARLTQMDTREVSAVDRAAIGEPWVVKKNEAGEEACAPFNITLRKAYSLGYTLDAEGEPILPGIHF